MYLVVIFLKTIVNFFRCSPHFNSALICNYSTFTIFIVLQFYYSGSEIKKLPKKINTAYCYIEIPSHIKCKIYISQLRPNITQEILGQPYHVFNTNTHYLTSYSFFCFSIDSCNK